MAVITVQTINRPGIQIAWSAASGGGDTFANTGVEQLWIRNDDVAATDATIAIGIDVDGNAVADLAVTQVAAGEIVAVGPFLEHVYGATVSITYTGVTSLTVAVVKV